MQETVWYKYIRASERRRKTMLANSAVDIAKVFLRLNMSPTMYIVYSNAVRVSSKTGLPHMKCLV